MQLVQASKHAEIDIRLFLVAVTYENIMAYEEKYF